ncbi:MAG: hypothetical protein AAFQ82_07650 [Myxococcota bacterium]
MNTPGWGARVVHAHGRSWQLRASDEPVGAGPNRWGDGSEQAWVDGSGALHLRSSNAPEDARAVEVSTPLPECHQRIRFVLDAALLRLPEEVIVGAFVYRDDKSEFDVEFGTWGGIYSDNAQFVVAPVDAARTRVHRFALDASSIDTELTWTEDSIEFEVLGADARTSWSYRGPKRPVPAAHRFHVNVWFLHGNAGGARPTEVVLRSFSVHCI